MICRIVLTLLGCWLLTGCDIVVSEQPLGTEPFQGDASAQEGVWQIEDEIYHVRHVESDTYALAALRWKDDAFEMTTSLVRLRSDGKQLYVSLESPAEIERPGTYLFARFRENKGGHLVVWAPRAETFKNAIATGQLEGEVVEESYSSTIIIRSDSQQLHEFIRATPASELWHLEEPAVLRRLRVSR